MEAYHVIASHPHQMLTSGDCGNTNYDVFGNWGRAAQFPSPGSPMRGIMLTKDEALAQYRRTADGQKGLIQALTGESLEDFSDLELQGGSFNDLFPNLHPWGGWMRICFRFRPNGSNPEESVMDIYLLAPWPKDKPRPAPAKHRKLGFDEAWTSAPELLSLSKITDQDVFNVPSVQSGLKAKSRLTSGILPIRKGRSKTSTESMRRRWGWPTRRPRAEPNGPGKWPTSTMT